MRRGEELLAFERRCACCERVFQFIEFLLPALVVRLRCLLGEAAEEFLLWMKRSATSASYKRTSPSSANCSMRDLRTEF